MNWGVPSFTRYFVILLLIFLFSLFQIYNFRQNYDLGFIFGYEESDF